MQQCIHDRASHELFHDVPRATLLHTQQAFDTVYMNPGKH